MVANFTVFNQKQEIAQWRPRTSHVPRASRGTGPAPPWRFCRKFSRGSDLKMARFSTAKGRRCFSQRVVQQRGTFCGSESWTKKSWSWGNRWPMIQSLFDHFDEIRYYKSRSWRTCTDPTSHPHGEQDDDLRGNFNDQNLDPNDPTSLWLWKRFIPHCWLTYDINLHGSSMYSTYVTIEMAPQ